MVLSDAKEQLRAGQTGIKYRTHLSFYLSALACVQISLQMHLIYELPHSWKFFSYQQESKENNFSVWNAVGSSTYTADQQTVISVYFHSRHF